MSEVKNIIKWNERVGNHRERRRLDDPKVMRNLRYCLSEVDELKDAMDDNDRREVVDGLFDVIFTAVGSLHMMGYDPERVMAVGNASNDSKFVDPDDHDSVEASIIKYENDDRYADVYMEVVDGVGVIKGTVVENGDLKVLKSIHFVEPIWNLIDRSL